MAKIRYHWDLEVHKLSVKLAMEIFDASKKFPAGERFSLTDQMRRSSRSISTQIAEAWRRRKYEAVFVHKLSEAEGEGAETQAWLEYAVKCGYLPLKVGRELHATYNQLLGKLANMGNHPEQWVLKRRD